MSATLELPYPRLSKGCFASLEALSDEPLFDATGIRIAFTGRSGGLSEGPYSSCNLADHVEDDVGAVTDNRELLKKAFGVEDVPLLVPRQVHGRELALIRSHKALDLENYREDIQTGVDGIVLGTSNVATLLCFADCVPIILVSPDRNCAVVHAGWRGVENKIVVQALHALFELPPNSDAEHFFARCNAYIGPYIHAECFETGPDIHEAFVSEFGSECAFDSSHIDLGFALRKTLCDEGVLMKRIEDADCCTVCNNDEYFSYRAQDGICGRHGAFAVRIER